MIKTFRNKHLAELFEKGASSKIDQKYHARILAALDVINTAANVREIDDPGLKMHALRQFKPVRYSVWISGQWRITFEFEKGDATRVDFEQYH